MKTTKQKNTGVSRTKVSFTVKKKTTKNNYLDDSNFREVIKQIYGLDNLTDEEFFSIIHSNPEFAKELIQIITEVIVLLNIKEFYGIGAVY